MSFTEEGHMNAKAYAGKCKHKEQRRLKGTERHRACVKIRMNKKMEPERNVVVAIHCSLSYQTLEEPVQ